MTNQSIVYLTQDGYDKIVAELKLLKEVKRPELAERLKEAISQGDLSENADYIKSKEDQGFLEGRIQDLEAKLSNYEIIEKKASNGVVEIGSTVTFTQGKSEPKTFQVVGAAEGNPREGKISNESPVGSKLLGSKEGDSISVQTPNGIIKLNVLKVE
jgi:transcription elongation factor GreA